MTRITQFTNLWLPLLLAMAMTAPCSIRVQAESVPPSSQSLPTNGSVYDPDSNVSSPGRREGGATRGDCIIKDSRNLTSKEYQLVALIPGHTKGRTEAEYPSFFVYLPSTNPEAKPEIEFTLMTAQKKEIYKTRFKVTGNAGIISLSLSNFGDLPPLKMNQDYRWTLKLICYPDAPERDNSQDQYVEGLIERMKPNDEVVGELGSAATPRDRLLAYAKAGFWYDALTTLAELRRIKGNDPVVTKDWEDLLKSVGLEKIAQEPLFQPLAGSERRNLPVSRDR